MALLVSFFAITINAQTAIPAKYVKATIYLANGNTINGFIKDNIRQSSSVVFLDELGKNKKQAEQVAAKQALDTRAPVNSING